MLRDDVYKFSYTQRNCYCMCTMFDFMTEVHGDFLISGRQLATTYQMPMPMTSLNSFVYAYLRQTKTKASEKLFVVFYKGL